MSHPEWVLKFKEKNTEIRNIKGKYYLYKITSKWDKDKKRTKKVTLGQVGVITEEYGLIPTGMKRKGRIPKGESPFKQKLETENKEAGFLDNFSKLNDERSERNRMYSIEEILLLTLMAIICGAEGWNDVEAFGKAKLPYLRSYLDYQNGIPSDDTLRRFYRYVNPNIFETLFRNWVETIAKKTNSEVIAIDGKSVRHSYDNDKKMVHVLSAFMTDIRIVIGQQIVSEKSNEITAIPVLLKWLDIQGHIITINAMGCQYSIADIILKKQGHYIFALKGNQSSLKEDISVYLNDPELSLHAKNYQDIDKGHGRIEKRKCWVIDNVSWLIDRHLKWKSIASIIRIDSTREISGKTTSETRFYIASFSANPDKMLQYIRSHWAIENTLHWILDMSFNEDFSRIRKGNAPYAIAIMRHIACNLLQLAKQNRQSIKGLRKICAWDNSVLDKVICQKFS